MDPKSGSDSEKIKKFLKDEGITFKDVTQGQHPAIKVYLKRESFQTAAMMSKLHEIAKFNEV